MMGGGIQRILYCNGISCDIQWVSVCIYDPPAASNYVVISGTATCTDQDLWGEARRIIERYRAADEVDDYVARWKTEPRVLLTITPEHIATRESRGREAFEPRARISATAERRKKSGTGRTARISSQGCGSTSRRSKIRGAEGAPVAS